MQTHHTPNVAPIASPKLPSTTGLHSATIPGAQPGLPPASYAAQNSEIARPDPGATPVGVAPASAIILNAPPAGEFVTVITSVEGKRLTKRVEPDPNGGFKIIDYDAGATWFRFDYVEVADLPELARVIAGLTQYQAIVPGRICDGIDPTRARRLAHEQKDGTPATLEDHRHSWLVGDFDKIPATDDAGEFDPVLDPERAARYLRNRLPPEFHNATCYYQLSSSAGFKRTDGKPTINMKLFFVLSRALTAAEQKAWLDPYIKEGATKKVKVKPNALLDGSMYQPERLIYLAKPELGEGVIDPVPRRSGIIDGGVVQVPEPEAMRPGGTGKVFDTKPDVEAAEGPPESEIVWDAPEAIAWAVETITKEREERGTPLDGKDTYSDIRAVKLGWKLKDGPTYGHSLREKTIAALLKQHWAPHFDYDWLLEKAERPGQNGAGCGPYGSASRLMGAHVHGAHSDPTASVGATDMVATIGSSEDGLALRFATGRHNQLAYVDERGDWLAFDGCRWRKVATPKVWNVIRPCVREVAADPTVSVTLARNLLKRSTIAGVEALARGHLIVPDEAFDAHAWALNTPAGIVDLHTGETHPAAPEAYCTKITAVAPGGDCPRWLQFLGEITGGDAELQAYLKRLIGCALVGEVVEHVLAFLYGTGGNGKGVFLNTITGVLGDYAKVAPIDTFTETKGDRHPTDMAMLRGARLVTAQETDEGRAWAEAKIKALTGGDPVTARFMHQDFFTYTPQFTLVIAGNHKPKLRNVDEAIKRRLHMVPFTQNIPAERRDPELSAKLREEWPGILQWAIEGCLAWQQLGLKPPAAVLGMTEQYFSEQDKLSAWLEDECFLAPDAWTNRSHLYDAYEQYTRRGGETPETRERFYAMLESHGFAAARRKHGRGYEGITLDPLHGVIL